MNELIGQRCQIIFSLPPQDWPIPGYPAFADVTAVDMPMIKFRSYGWINCAVIQQIKAIA